MDEVKLLPWPFFGYAPGNYMATCRRCGEVKSDLDKRAISCLECAVLAAKEIGKDQRDLISQLSRARPTIVTDEVVERVARAMAADRTKRHYRIDRGTDEAWEALTDYHREEMLHAARAAIAAMPTIDQDGGWQPFETVPRDGSLVQMFREDRGIGIGSVKSIRFDGLPITSISTAWAHDDGSIYMPSNDNVHPTHWQPLPEPPAQPEVNQS